MESPAPSAQNDPQFTTGDTRLSALLDAAHSIADLSAAVALLSWDQNTAMPDGAGAVRGEQLATLQGIIHDRQSDPKLVSAVEQARGVIESENFTDADRGLVRQLERITRHATRLPRAFVEEMTRVEASSFEAWRRARANNDFASFAPWLTRTIALQREMADYFGYTENRYDALLDLYEPGLTTRQVETLFGPVRDTSLGLLRRIEQSGHTVDDTALEGDWAQDAQVSLSHNVLERMGYDFTRGGLAQSPHPFTIDFGSPYDVRVTVRTDPHRIEPALMAAIHEGGHALYEQGSAPALARTPVAGGASMGAHESQSRLWENAIGRSSAFWQGQFDAVRKAFPQAYASTDPAVFARALNKVQPSLIRTEADEVTYNLHIIIRFEMERMMVNEEVAVESLPRLWNEKYQQYLGITPPTDSDGILQDVHWTSGFGYFPTYTLGNLYAAQIYAALRRAFPDFDERLASGDTSFALSWLRERMYCCGATYLPAELITRVTGASPDPSYFARYLNDKFEHIYDLPR